VCWAQLLSPLLCLIPLDLWILFQPVCLLLYVLLRKFPVMSFSKPSICFRITNLYLHPWPLITASYLYIQLPSYHFHLMSNRYLKSNMVKTKLLVSSLFTQSLLPSFFSPSQMTVVGPPSYSSHKFWNHSWFSHFFYPPTSNQLARANQLARTIVSAFQINPWSNRFCPFNCYLTTASHHPLSCNPWCCHLVVSPLLFSSPTY
jgi:hypothetical protein